MKSREKRRRRQLRKARQRARGVQVTILWETLRYLSLKETEAGRSL